MQINNGRSMQCGVHFARGAEVSDVAVSTRLENGKAREAAREIKEGDKTKTAHLYLVPVSVGKVDILYLLTLQLCFRGTKYGTATIQFFTVSLMLIC